MLLFKWASHQNVHKQPYKIFFNNNKFLEYLARISIELFWLKSVKTRDDFDFGDGGQT